MTQPSFSTRGVVDLGALRSAPPAGATGPSTAGGAVPPAAGGPVGGFVYDVTEADFQSRVLEASMTVPVLIDFWATWCGPCKTLSPILERLAAADAGRWVLAKIDVDANQRLAAAFQVQSIPSVFAVLKGQPVPLFQGALPERQVRQYLDEVLRVAAANGVTGQAGGVPAEATPLDGLPEEDALPPEIEKALDAVDRGDYDAAAAAYQGVLAADPADPMARAGLAQVELLRRTATLDLDGALRAAQQRPDDLDAQFAAADAEVLSDQADAAFTRIIGVVRRTAGPERERARQRLLHLFEVVGPDDPRVARARTALANALF